MAESGFHREGEDLYAEGVPLQEIADRFGTPCYVYSRGAIQARWERYRQALGSQGTLCYAVKANSNLAVLGILAQVGASFDIVSAGELARVLRAGGDAGRVTFSGVGKGTQEIRRALLAGIRCFNVESGQELERIDRIAGEVGVKATVAIRINPDVEAGTHPHITTGVEASKFGVPLEEAESLITGAEKYRNVRVQGLAFHIGSQLTSVAPVAEAASRVAALYGRLRAAGVPLDHVDAGGGLGIRYADETPPTPKEHVEAVATAFAGMEPRLFLEPGRAIVGEAGVLLTRIEYLKSHGTRRFAVVDAGMNDHLRPALYDAWHEIEAVGTTRRSADAVDIVGPVCESADSLGKDRYLEVTPGSVLAIYAAGAYGFVMASHYNSRPRPAEIIVDGQHAHLVRRRETVDDLLRGESLLPRG